MRIVRARDYDDMSRKAANIVSAQVIVKPNSTLGLCTGSTPVGTYQQLIDWYNKGDVSFAEVTTYNLDEYVGLTADHVQSFAYFMNDTFFDHIDIDKSRTHIPDGTNPDAEGECAAYDEMLEAANYFDLLFLGIGHNGHVGFNEPGEVFSKGACKVDLTESTIRANSRFFETEDEVPRHAYTMGMQAIMRARQILVAVSGADKAEAVRGMCTGLVTPHLPASILQLHPNCVVVADEAALSALDAE